MTKGSIPQEDMTSLLYAPSPGAHKCIKQILTCLKWETYNMILVLDFNSPLKKWIDHQERKSGNIRFKLYFTPNKPNIYMAHSTQEPHSIHYS